MRDVWSWAKPGRTSSLCALALAASISSLADTGKTSSVASEKMVPTFWAYNFSDSVGVNTHLLHPDSFYGAQFGLMKQKLLSARIKHIRDGAMDQHGQFFAGDQAERFAELGRAGIRAIFMFHASAPKEFVEGFPARVDPAFEAYELPNEFNIQHKLPWLETLRSWMPAFRQYVKGSSVSSSYPIIGPSLVDFGSDPYRVLGNQEQYIDFGNLHKYYRNYNPKTPGYGGWGKPPCSGFRYGSLDYAMCNAANTSGAKPIICTEAGYGSNPSAGKQVTPSVQAKYIARMLMLHLKAGFRRTYIYQLADYGNDGFGNFGILTENGDEKPAFRELSSLMNEMDDRTPSKMPSGLSISITGDVGDVESALFEKSDGSYRLVLWLEKPSYDPKANFNIGAPIGVQAQTIMLTLPKQYRVRRLVSFDDSGTAKVDRQSMTSAPSELVIGDNLSIVDIAQDSGSDPIPAAPGHLRVIH